VEFGTTCTSGHSWAAAVSIEERRRPFYLRAETVGQPSLSQAMSLMRSVGVPCHSVS